MPIHLKPDCDELRARRKVRAEQASKANGHGSRSHQAALLVRAMVCDGVYSTLVQEHLFGFTTCCNGSRRHVGTPSGWPLELVLPWGQAVWPAPGPAGRAWLEPRPPGLLPGEGHQPPHFAPTPAPPAEPCGPARPWAAPARAAAGGAGWPASADSARLPGLGFPATVPAEKV